MSPRRLGQHFLADASWRERILRHLRPQRDDAWLEIGAGHGEMTRELARAARRVVAVELDPPLIDTLRELASRHRNIEIVAGNILALDLQKLLGEQKFRVYGSLPYYITSPILRRLFEAAERLEAIYVVIQFEVAARIVAAPGRRDYGFLSVLAQHFAQPEILLRIPPGAFRPRPKVDSALVALRLRPDRGEFAAEEEKQFLEFVGTCFAQKRKTLLNNLKGGGAARAQAALCAAGISENARAEQLSVQQFAELFRAWTTIRSAPARAGRENRS
ncbi:MAG TPA: 16S rRNA (adenine(1518)-N(6)/adenine(1519)-N(6))-dimethyltransferase RsmA [Candidatus Nitrosotenuis sp.]|nr:16S rRNA (adenine(1518)-N(6)/adenine(1519)-N(6))-dimethyltransferase RsmA [Candidatus Nitrosotenuis sp.]